jgi:phage/plasmid primase-like uncharacterized protein
VALDAEVVKGNDVKGLETADNGRVSIVGFENTWTWTLGDKEYTVKYPTLRFRNFRKHFSEPVIFDGYKALMDEYDAYRGGKRVTRCQVDPQKESEFRVSAEKRKEEKKAKTVEAIGKDARWLKMLVILKEPCPYFTSKGIEELFRKVNLYLGKTTKGKWIGRFTAIVLRDALNWSFRGIQRIYPDIPMKVFRAGLDPTGACFAVPDRLPKDGEPIYVMEAPADAGKCNQLTDCYSVAAMYADNIGNVVAAMRMHCPNSPIIVVADNDQYPDDSGKIENKGVEVCESVLRDTEGDVFGLIPQFKEAEKKKKYKDLTDYSIAYGDEQARIFLTSY